MGNMKKNFGKFGKHIKNITKSDKPDPHSGRNPRPVCVRCGSGDTPATPTLCACGEEVEFCRCQDFSFVPILLNHSLAKHETDSMIIPLEGEEEIYPTTRKAVKTVK